MASPSKIGWYCKRCSCALVGGEKTCPNCGAADPGVQTFSVKHEFGAAWPVIAFVLLAALGAKWLGRDAISGFAGYFLVGALFAVLPAAFLAMFGKPRWGLPLIYLGLGLEVLGFLTALLQ